MPDVMISREALWNAATWRRFFSNKHPASLPNVPLSEILDLARMERAKLLDPSELESRANSVSAEAYK
jgi:hypothetical protein